MKATVAVCLCPACAAFTLALDRHLKARRHGGADADRTYRALQSAAAAVDERHHLRGDPFAQDLQEPIQ